MKSDPDSPQKKLAPAWDGRQGVNGGNNGDNTNTNKQREAAGTGITSLNVLGGQEQGLS